VNETESICIVGKDSGLYDELIQLLISLQSLYISVEYLRTGKVHCNDGGFISIEGRLLPRMIRLPANGALQAAMKNVLPDYIEVAVSAVTPSSHTHWYSGMQTYCNNLANSMLVTYLELYRKDIEDRCGKRPQWPDSWQMAWAIRNALSHNGTVFDKAERSAITWRTYTIAPSDEPMKKILEDVNTADLVILLLEMEADRTGHPLPSC
jgi:hypothetical protein